MMAMATGYGDSYSDTHTYIHTYILTYILTYIQGMYFGLRRLVCCLGLPPSLGQGERIS